MPSDHKLFDRARRRWEGLRKEELLSVPPELGATAIISVLFTDEPPDTQTGISELASFRNEARELARRVHAAGGKPELAIDASRDDITALIQDPSVATLFMIGNGSLSSLMLGEKDYYDWLDVANATDHLKQGKFIQRQCGGRTRFVNVPMGLFAVSDPRDLHATLDDAFYPPNLDDPVNDRIGPIFANDLVTYLDIKALGSVRIPGSIL